MDDYHPFGKVQIAPELWLYSRPHLTIALFKTLRWSWFDWPVSLKFESDSVQASVMAWEYSFETRPEGARMAGMGPSLLEGKCGSGPKEETKGKPAQVVGSRICLAISGGLDRGLCRGWKLG